MKVKFFLYTLLITSIFAENNDDSNNLFEDNLSNLMQELGFANRTNITKPEFKKFFFHLIKNDDSEFKDFYDIVYTKYSESIPDIILKEDIAKYINFSSFQEKILETVEEQYGPEYTNEVNRALNKEEF